MFFWTLKAGHHWSVSEFPKYNYYRHLISIIVVWQSNCVKAWTLICVQHWGGEFSLECFDTDDLATGRASGL